MLKTLYANSRGRVKVHGKLSLEFTTSSGVFNFVIGKIMKDSLSVSTAYEVELLPWYSFTVDRHPRSALFAQPHEVWRGVSEGQVISFQRSMKAITSKIDCTGRYVWLSGNFEKGHIYCSAISISTKPWQRNFSRTGRVWDLSQSLEAFSERTYTDSLTFIAFEVNYLVKSRLFISPQQVLFPNTDAHTRTADVAFTDRNAKQTVPPSTGNFVFHIRIYESILRETSLTRMSYSI
ncbi:hypothetical protein CLF_111087 [Clonorchis sinensis]|uniref:Uncharacterized protein n=1 Tax=Clonorchis sinensis TaxID=79923 RepID=G7YUB8_CLOSI|nr:hypothetical protein CLF_111087 [Clonorchis sinensis]